MNNVYIFILTVFPIETRYINLTCTPKRHYIPTTILRTKKV